MSEEGLKAIQPKSFTPKTTDSKGTKASPNLLANIKLEECAAEKIIIGDITYLPMKSGKFCYLAVWQDKITRRIIGWSLAETMIAELVISALEKAILKEKVQAGAIIHSDRGSQYAAAAFWLFVTNQLFTPIYRRKVNPRPADENGRKKNCQKFQLRLVNVFQAV